MAHPLVRLYGFQFHGMFTASEIRRFERRLGVYIVSCACKQDSYDLEIGQTADVQSFLLTHFDGNKICKCPSGSGGPVYYAAFYCPEGGKHDRKKILAKIRKRAGLESNESAD